MAFQLKKRDVAYVQGLVVFIAGTVVAWMFIGINAVGIALLYGVSTYLFLKGPFLLQQKVKPKDQAKIIGKNEQIIGKIIKKKREDFDYLE